MVAEIDQELSRFSDKEFEDRFDLAAMEEAELYPGIWDEPRSDLLSEYRHYFQATKAFFHRAAEQNCRVIVFVS